MSNPNNDRFLRVRDVIGDKESPGIVPLSRSAWYELVRTGRAPAPVKIGRASLWRESDIQRFIAQSGA